MAAKSRRGYCERCASCPWWCSSGCGKPAKSTLLQNEAGLAHGHVYRTLDDFATLAAARANPESLLEVATILDEAMGKVNKLRHVIALTSQITVDYLKPVPLNQPLRVESREVRVRGREHINMAAILNSKDEVLARSRGLFIAIDPQKMFAKFVER